MFKKILFILTITLFALLSISCIWAESNVTDEISLQTSASSDKNNLNTFSDLQNEIKTAEDDSKLYLSGTYKYDKNSDKTLKNGIVINKDLTIIGKNGCTIDGSGLARCLRIKESCTVTLKNIVIKNGYTTTNGGGIKINSNSKVIIEKCKFYNNVAHNSNGGAIESKKSCTIKISSSYFYSNKATHSGKLPWDSNKNGMGGAIKTSVGSTLKIYDSTFKSNKAYLTTILVVSLSDSTRKTSSLYVKNCYFSKNKSQHNGVIYSDEYGKAKIEKSTFKKNYSPKGAGMIVLESSKTGIVKNCKFYKNKGCNGAAINVKIYKSKDSSKVTISNCKFSKNSASMYGGAICSVGGKVTVKSCKFSSNTASIFGGAIYARLGTLHISSSKFYKNKAKYAGAICLACKKGSVKHSSITKNIVYYLYSGIYNIEHNKVSKCHIKSNVNLKYSKTYLYKSGKYIKVKVTDNKDKSIKKHVKLTFKGNKKIKTKWHKTSDKKYIKIKIPKSVKGTYKVTMKVKKAKYFRKTINIKV